MLRFISKYNYILYLCKDTSLFVKMQWIRIVFIDYGKEKDCCDEDRA